MSSRKPYLRKMNDSLAERESTGNPSLSNSLLNREIYGIVREIGLDRLPSFRNQEFAMHRLMMFIETLRLFQECRSAVLQPKITLKANYLRGDRPSPPKTGPCRIRVSVWIPGAILLFFAGFGASAQTLPLPES